MNAYKFALDMLHFSGTAWALRRRCQGMGAVLTLHHVRPKMRSGPFSPNRILEITPEFLESTIIDLQRCGYEFISLDELHARLTQRRSAGRFVCITIDDGYVDNYTHAYPIFKRHEIPFAIYICTGILDRSVHLWWCELESIVQQADLLQVELNGAERTFRTDTEVGKRKAFNEIYWQLRSMPIDAQLEKMEWLRRHNAHDIDSEDSEPLSWAMVQEMLESGLLTIGGHTVNHYALSKLSGNQLCEEMQRGCNVIKEHTGVTPAHFAYPYGDRLSAGAREFEAARKLGFATAVTTRKGVVTAAQSKEPLGVPRISLNGDYQNLRYVRTLLTGVPTALYQFLNGQEATC